MATKECWAGSHLAWVVRWMSLDVGLRVSEATALPSVLLALVAEYLLNGTCGKHMRATKSLGSRVQNTHQNFSTTVSENTRQAHVPWETALVGRSKSVKVILVGVGGGWGSRYSMEAPRRGAVTTASTGCPSLSCMSTAEVCWCSTVNMKGNNCGMSLVVVMVKFRIYLSHGWSSPVIWNATPSKFLSMDGHPYTSISIKPNSPENSNPILLSHKLPPAPHFFLISKFYPVIIVLYQKTKLTLP
jgi:hypothetical protein